MNYFFRFRFWLCLIFATWRSFCQSLICTLNNICAISGRFNGCLRLFNLYSFVNSLYFWLRNNISFFYLNSSSHIFLRLNIIICLLCTIGLNRLWISISLLIILSDLSLLNKRSWVARSLNQWCSWLCCNFYNWLLYLHSCIYWGSSLSFWHHLSSNRRWFLIFFSSFSHDILTFS